MNFVPNSIAAALAAYRAHGNMHKAAKALGVRYDTARRMINDGLEREFEVETKIPSPETPIPELIERLKADSIRKREHAAATKLIRVQVKVDGPFGMLVFGDPHLGSSLTDWVAISRDLALVKSTPGLFGTNIGDTGDNWSGKLAHLWAENDVSHSNEFRLSHWFLSEIPWLLWIYGNHDLWSGPGCPIKWLSQQYGTLSADWSQRICLVPPSGRETRVGVYHGARGHSQWNSVHGGIKTARLGARDHLVCAGHIHKAQVLFPIVDPDSGDWATILQVGSYKNISDAYGKRLGDGESNAFPSAVVIIDPHATNPAGHVKVYADTEEGAAVLTWKRQRFASGKSNNE